MRIGPARTCGPCAGLETYLLELFLLRELKLRLLRRQPQPDPGPPKPPPQPTGRLPLPGHKPDLNRPRRIRPTTLLSRPPELPLTRRNRRLSSLGALRRYRLRRTQPENSPSNYPDYNRLTRKEPVRRQCPGLNRPTAQRRQPAPTLNPRRSYHRQSISPRLRKPHRCILPDREHSNRDHSRAARRKGARLNK